MGKRKWIPISEEKVIETERCKYVLGLYDHHEYGRSCFRISKYIRGNGFFVGHFVVVPEDQETVLPEIIEHIQHVVQRLVSLPNMSEESIDIAGYCRNHPLPGMEEGANL